MISFLVVGDWGRLGLPEQRAVAQSMGRVAERLNSLFILSTGDNFYDDGVTGLDDPHWARSFEAVYTAPSLQRPWYVTLGNHDYRGDVDAQIAYTERSTRWRLPARYHEDAWHIDATTQAHFFFLDTTPFLPQYHSGGSEYTEGVEAQDQAAQLHWLRRALARSAARWKVVVGHHPILSGSPFHGGSADLDQVLMPLFQEYGVQAYFCGHEHDLQHLRAEPGLHCFVSGAGSEYRVTGRIAETIFSRGTLGFAAVHLRPDEMGVEFYGVQADLLYSTVIPQAAYRAPRSARLAS